MILWSLTIAISISLLAFTAAERSGDIGMAYINIAIAAISCAIFVLLALRSSQRVQAGGGSRMAIAADTALSMSLVYFWGTLGLAVIYGTGILGWKEWWHFLLAFLGVGAVCLGMHFIMQSKVKSGEEDEKLLIYSDYATMAQLIGMIIIVLGLLIDGKMIRFINPRAGWEDWGANNIFFFGAVALAVISAYAMWTRKRMQDS